MEKEIKVVIETGSSAVCGAAGYKRPDGMMEVMAYVSEPSDEFIRCGVVRNIDKTAQCLTNIINRLEEMMPRTNIDQVYVGLDGCTFHTMPNRVERGFDEVTRITDEMVDSMIEDNLEYTNSDKAVVDVVPQEYSVDGVVTNDPAGCNCCHIVGDFLNIAARLSTVNYQREAFELSHLPIADTLFTPSLLAQMVLTSTERSLGCAFVDMGAGKTTVSIYRGGRLRYLSVIPMGDKLITSDLVTLGIGEEEAQRIKCLYGLTIDSADATSSYTTESGTTISLKEIGRVIRARMLEILANVVNQVKLSGYTDDKLNAGFIFTGGALELPGLGDYINRQPAFMKKSRVATYNADTVVWSAAECPTPSKQMTLATLLAACSENCCTITAPKEYDYNTPGLTTGSLFGDEEITSPSAPAQPTPAPAPKPQSAPSPQPTPAPQPAPEPTTVQQSAEPKDEPKPEQPAKTKTEKKRGGLFTRLQKSLMDDLFEDEQ